MAGVFFENSVVTRIFFEYASLECHATILIDVFILVFPNAYVILLFVLKGSFTGVRNLDEVLESQDHETHHLDKDSAIAQTSPPKRLALTWSTYQTFSIRTCQAAFFWSAPPPAGVRALPRGHSLESETVDADVRGRVLDMFAQRSGDRPPRPSRQLLSLPRSGHHWRFPSECRTDVTPRRRPHRWFTTLMKHLKRKRWKKSMGLCTGLAKRALRGKLVDLLLTLRSSYARGKPVCPGRPWTKKSSLEEFVTVAPP